MTCTSDLVQKLMTSCQNCWMRVMHVSGRVSAQYRSALSVVSLADEFGMCLAIDSTGFWREECVRGEILNFGGKPKLTDARDIHPSTWTSADHHHHLHYLSASSIRAQYLMGNWQ